jgi:3-hydroxyisobutyrate dehydrogenase
MRIGFIGLGAMGRPMAASLQRAGHDLQVHDLRRVEGFANFKASVTEAAKDCEVLFTSLPGPRRSTR